MTDELGTQILGIVNTMNNALTGHMKDEGLEIKEIRDKIEDTREDLVAWRIAAENRHLEAVAAADKRHSELIRSLESWTTKMDMSAAFPKDKKGQPDLGGHCTHHETLIEEAQASKERVEKLKTAWAEKAGWAVVIFVSFAVWEYFKAHIK